MGNLCDTMSYYLGTSEKKQHIVKKEATKMISSFEERMGELHTKLGVIIHQKALCANNLRSVPETHKSQRNPYILNLQRLIRQELMVQEAIKRLQKNAERAEDASFTADSHIDQARFTRLYRKQADAMHITISEVPRASQLRDELEDLNEEYEDSQDAIVEIGESGSRSGVDDDKVNDMVQAFIRETVDGKYDNLDEITQNGNRQAYTSSGAYTRNSQYINNDTLQVPERTPLLQGSQQSTSSFVSNSSSKLFSSMTSVAE